MRQILEVVLREWVWADLLFIELSTLADSSEAEGILNVSLELGVVGTLLQCYAYNWWISGDCKRAVMAAQMFYTGFLLLSKFVLFLLNNHTTEKSANADAR